jgi:hypothetical protein
MDKLETLEQAYEVILDEIDTFMEAIYKEKELIARVLKDIEEQEGFEIDTDLLNHSPIEATLGRIDNLKTVIKTIAFQNHSLNLFTKSELENDEMLRLIVESDNEV